MSLLGTDRVLTFSEGTQVVVSFYAKYNTGYRQENCASLYEDDSVHDFGYKTGDSTGIMGQPVSFTAGSARKKLTFRCVYTGFRGVGEYLNIEDVQSSAKGAFVVTNMVAKDNKGRELMSILVVELRKSLEVQVAPEGTIVVAEYSLQSSRAPVYNRMVFEPRTTPSSDTEYVTDSRMIVGFDFPKDTDDCASNHPNSPCPNMHCWRHSMGISISAPDGQGNSVIDLRSMNIRSPRAGHRSGQPCHDLFGDVPIWYNYIGTSTLVKDAVADHNLFIVAVTAANGGQEVGRDRSEYFPFSQAKLTLMGATAFTGALEMPTGFSKNFRWTAKVENSRIAVGGVETLT